MNLTPCRCPNCGANMQVDASKNIVFCTFCGSSLLVEKTEKEQGARGAGMDASDDFVVKGTTLEQYVGTATEVVIPQGIKTIKGAFNGCDRVTSIVIPNSVTNIGNAAFYGCRSLRSIKIPDSVVTIGAYAFDGCVSLTGIELPKKIVSIALGTFNGCKGLVSITIPDSVRRIGEDAFHDCTSLRFVTIPDGVDEITVSSFSNCTKLTAINASPQWRTRFWWVHPCLQSSCPKGKGMMKDILKNLLGG